jgi:hypothetical protein
MRTRLFYTFASFLVCLFVTGCSGRAAATRLTILAVNPNIGRAVFHVQCRPQGGDVPDTNRTCAAIASTPGLITRPKPFVCFGGPSSWWDVTISGRLNGRLVHSKTSTCWTSQMRLINALGIERAINSHLEPRRRKELVAAERRRFPPGQLRPGDLVTCTTHGHVLQNGVPDSPEGGGTVVGWGGTTIIASLTVILHHDGSVSGICN